MLKPYDVLVVSYKKPKRGKVYFLVELSAAIAPFVLHVAHHAEQLSHVPIQEFVVVLDHSFQVLHTLPHRLNSPETFVDRCVEIRDGVTASRTTQRMHPKRVVITRVVAIITVIVIGVTTAIRTFGSILLWHLFPIVEVVVLPFSGRP
jgi:hypothetical protein